MFLVPFDSQENCTIVTVKFSVCGQTKEWKGEEFESYAEASGRSSDKGEFDARSQDMSIRYQRQSHHKLMSLSKLRNRLPGSKITDLQIAWIDRDT